MHLLRYRSCSLCIALLVLGSLFGVGPRQAAAVTFDSPEVKGAIDKALKYMAGETHPTPGGKCLIALAFKKNGHDANHPKVKEALAEVTKIKFDDPNMVDNYNLGLMIIFLCELEDKNHASVIQQMVAELLKRQKPHGGWGYPVNVTGDTSQTQYAVLAIWMAERHNYDVPLPVIERAINWLLRTQDSSGGWGYQAQDPGSPDKRVKQEPLTMSLTSAALSSLYILTDLISLPGAVVQAPGGGTKLPPALQEVEDQMAAQRALRRRPTAAVDAARVRKAMEDGKAWLRQNFTLEPHEWKHYAFYAYERYESFREELERDQNPEPKWYNDIFENLKKSQVADGSWLGMDSTVVTTAFSVLVLSRSTKKAIKRAETLGEGVFVGGMGLPTNVADLKEKNGKIVDSPLTGTIDELLSILEDDNDPELVRLAESNQVLQLDADITRRTSQVAKLRGMVSSGTFETRLVAVRSLAKVRDLDNVPVLLFALRDRDLRVIREADRGLRFVSRKFDGVIPLDAPNNEALASLRNRWRQWYLSIRPDAELID